MIPKVYAVVPTNIPVHARSYVLSLLWGLGGNRCKESSLMDYFTLQF